MRNLLLIALVSTVLLMIACKDNDDPTGPGTPPEASTLSVDSVTTTTAYLSWTECTDDDFQSYRLYRSETVDVSAQDTTGLGCLYYSLQDSSTAFSDTSIVPGITYYYALITDDTEDLHAWSNEVTAFVEVPLECPDSVTATIPINNPRDICFSPSGDYAYVSGFDGIVSIIDTSDHSVIGTVNYSPYLDHNCMLPDGNHAYVVWYENTDRQYPSSVLVIDTSTWTIQNVIQIGLNARGICTVPGKELAYVCNAGEESIYVINTQTHTMVTIIQTGSYNTRDVCALPSGEYVYATRTNSDDVIVIDTSSNNIVDSIYTVNNDPDGLAVLPSGEYVLVGSWGNRVEVIRTSDNSIETTILVPSGVRDFGIQPDGDYVYIPAGNQGVGIIDMQVMQTVEYIDLPQGGTCRYLESSPSGDLVYVSCLDTDMVVALE